MSFSKISALGGLITLASSVAAHGTVTGIVADGVYYEGYHANFQYLQTEPVVVGWSTPEDLSNGFIAPSAYDNPDIICHLGATNAMTSASVKAGGTVEMQWTPWPTSHHGPVIDYLAKCNNDDCTTVDKTTLEFFKIDGQGLISDTTIPGNWASDTLIANNNSWTVTIPTDIAPGNYVLRHEIIALHSAESADGAQNYPFCFNLAITGSGTATPAGTLGTDLYHETDPGILVDIYNTLSTYIVPGPTLYSGAVSVSQTAQPSAPVVASVGSATSAAVSTTAISAVVTPAPTSTFLPSASGAIPKYNSTQGAPYLNSTISTSKSKSACKVRPTSTTVLPAATTTTALSATAVATQTSSSTSTTEILIQTPTATPSSAPSSTSITPPSLPTFTTSPTVSISAPTTTPTSTIPEIPEGTALNTLLSWLAAFYNKFAGTEYNADTVAVISRRHARDLNALLERKARTN